MSSVGIANDSFKTPSGTSMTKVDLAIQWKKE